MQFVLSHLQKMTICEFWNRINRRQNFWPLATSWAEPSLNGQACCAPPAAVSIIPPAAAYTRGSQLAGPADEEWSA
jgi:hypothetical protein